MRLELYLRELHPDPQAAGRRRENIDPAMNC